MPYKDNATRRAAYHANPARHTRAKDRYRYGITRDDMIELLGNDDCTICGPEDDVVQAAKYFSNAANKINLKVNPRKCCLIALHKRPISEETQRQLDRNFDERHKGHWSSNWDNILRATRGPPHRQQREENLRHPTHLRKDPKASALPIPAMVSLIASCRVFIWF